MCGPNTRIGHGVSVGAYAILEDGVVVGDDCRIGAHTILRRDTTLGERTTVDSFAVIGGAPQDRAFDEAVRTRVAIGRDVTIREGVTVNRSTCSQTPTIVGPDSVLMANCHVAHDCQVGTSVVLANNVMLGGHVEIGDFANLGGGAGIHQFVRIGQGAMIGGNASISRDVPPFGLAAGHNELRGLNLVGMRRQGLLGDDIAAVKRCFQLVCLDGKDPQAIALTARSDGSFTDSKIGSLFLEFFADGVRGFVRLRRNPR